MRNRPNQSHFMFPDNHNRALELVIARDVALAKNMNHECVDYVDWFDKISVCSVPSLKIGHQNVSERT